ncbi:MAG TPA: TldD/PmbA family protein [candidate division Zixibacteria bacterium]
MKGKDKILSTLDKMVKQSKADHTEAVYIGGESGLTRYANSTIHQNVSELNSKVYFRTALGKKIGVASTNSLDENNLKKALASALEIAKNQKDNPYFDSLPPKADYRKIDTYIEETAKFSPLERAERVQKIFEMARPYKLDVAGSFTTGEVEIGVANSRGVVCYQGLTSSAINIIAMSDTSSGYSDALSRDVDEIDVDDLAEAAIKKCLDSRNPKEVEPGEYTVILEPVAVGCLMEWLGYIAFGSKPFLEGTSFIAGNVGKKMMGENITIYDDGNDPSGIAFPFDFEGVPKRKVTFVEKGIAKEVVFNTIDANQGKTKSTGHSLTPDSSEGGFALNVFIQGGNSSLEKMIQSTEKGILITRFHYINGYLDTRVALMTGMTRDGTFWIENGKVKHGIKNLRFTESMTKAFSNVVALSKERKIVNVWWGDVGCTVTPAMLIKNFKFTGKTEF